MSPDAREELECRQACQKFVADLKQQMKDFTEYGKVKPASEYLKPE